MLAASTVLPSNPLYLYVSSYGICMGIYIFPAYVPINEAITTCLCSLPYNLYGTVHMAFPAENMGPLIRIKYPSTYILLISGSTSAYCLPLNANLTDTWRRRISKPRINSRFATPKMVTTVFRRRPLPRLFGIVGAELCIHRCLYRV